MQPRDGSEFPIAWFLALLGWSLLVGCFSLKGGATMEGTECWVAQTAREMLERNDWIVPYFSGELRLQKSPGAYWAVMLAAKLRGVPVDDVATRLPNALAAVLLVACVFLLGRRIGGNRAAVFGGFAAASSALFLHWSHRGASDLALTSLMTASLTCLWIAFDRDVGGRRRILLFLGAYMLAGLAMLYKMPMPLVCVGLPAVLYALLQRRWEMLFNRWHLVGLALFLAMWVPWAVAIYFMEPAAIEKWRYEYFARFTGDMAMVQDRKVWYMAFFYIPPLLMYTAPYTLSVPSAVVRVFRRDDRVNKDGMRFLLIWGVSLFLFFTIAIGKESRYILPVLPPFFVLLGVELERVFDPRRRYAEGTRRLIWWSVAILVPVAFIVAGYLLHRWHQKESLPGWREMLTSFVVVAVIFTVCAVYAARSFLKRRHGRAFAGMVGAMWVSFCVAWFSFLPQFASQDADLDFAQQLRERIDPDMHAHMYQVSHQNPTVIWHSDVRYPRIVDQLELLDTGGQQRTRPRDRRIVGEAMIRKLGGEEPCLLVIRREDYLAFFVEGPKLAAELGLDMPETHLWIQSRVGSKRKQMMVLANISPPWPEPELSPPSKALQRFGAGSGAGSGTGSRRESTAPESNESEGGANGESVDERPEPPTARGRNTNSGKNDGDTDGSANGNVNGNVDDKGEASDNKGEASGKSVTSGGGKTIGKREASTKGETIGKREASDKSVTSGAGEAIIGKREASTKGEASGTAKGTAV